MRAEERRRAIAEKLMSSEIPITGRSLSEEFRASRQIIVSDISVLKALGYEILSTHSGYIMKSSPHKERVFKVRHTSSETATELSTIVELGGTVVDVFVWHKVYGRIEAKLNIFSARGVEQFIEGIKSGKSTELMHITSGYHYHTVRADNEATLDIIGNALAEKNYIVPEC